MERTWVVGFFRRTFSASSFRPRPFLYLFCHRDNVDIMLKLTLFFVVVQPDKFIGIRDNIYIMTTCSTAPPIPLPALACPLYSGQGDWWLGYGTFLILPRVSSRVCHTRNLLSAENDLIVFLPQVTPFPLFPRVTPFPPGKLFVIHKLFVIREIQVGLAGQNFSRDFVCSPTHCCCFCHRCHRCF
jgi:hypothetical protein